MKSIPVPADDLLHLIDERNSWAGSMPPEDREEYIAYFAELRKQANDAVLDVQRMARRARKTKRVIAKLTSSE